MKKILVDMSVVILHHGHIRLLRTASKIGTVTVGLSSDEDIIKYKGFKPPLTWSQRKEILQAIKYVEEVIFVPYIITNDILDMYGFDYLIHGDEQTLNNVSKDRLITIPRTQEVSSREICKNIKKN